MTNKGLISPEIKSSNEVLGDELLRMEAKFQVRAVVEASKEFEKDPDGPTYKSADMPRLNHSVVRKDGGDAVEKSKVREDTYLRDCPLDDERKFSNLDIRG